MSLQHLCKWCDVAFLVFSSSYFFPSREKKYGCWGLVVLAGCDADHCYNILSCMYSGSTNDSLAWDICGASKIVEHEDWPM